MKEPKSTNPELIQLIRLLKKQGNEREAKIWRDVAKHLSKTRQQRAAVNISRINRHTKNNKPAHSLSKKISHTLSYTDSPFN